jgi:hypothetical protein
VSNVNVNVDVYGDLKVVYDLPCIRIDRDLAQLGGPMKRGVDR